MEASEEKKEPFSATSWMLIAVALALAFLVGQAAYSWTLFVNVSNNAGQSLHPSIAIDSANVIHVVWADNTATYQNNLDVFYKKSSDGGLTWSTPKNLSSSKETSTGPVIAAAGPSNVVVAWSEEGRVVARIWNGVSWSTVFILSRYTSSASLSVGVVERGHAIVTWRDLTQTSSTYMYSVWRPQTSSWSTNSRSGSRSPVAMRGDAGYVIDQERLIMVTDNKSDYQLFSLVAGLPTGYSLPDDMKLDSRGRLYMAWYATDSVKAGWYDPGTRTFGPVQTFNISPLNNPFRRLGLAINGNNEITLIWTDADTQTGTYPDIRTTYQVMASQSKDGINWTPPSRVLTPGACSSAVAGAAVGTAFYGVVQSPDCGSGQSPDVFVIVRQAVLLPRAYLPIVVR